MPPRAQIDYLAELGQARCHAEVLKRRNSPTQCEIDPVTNCWLFTGSRITDGYAQFKTKKNSNLGKTGPAAQTAFLLHVVSFVGTRAQNPAPGTQVSHLCDRRAGFNPGHLRDETPQVNNSRKGCAGPIFCHEHGSLLIDLCPHTPRCIRHPREDTSCCLQIQEGSSRWATPVTEDS